MCFFTYLAATGLALISGVIGTPYKSDLSKRCTNSPTSRSCWGNYDITTDYYNTVPDTGVTYYFSLINTTASLDGVSRQVLLVNGTFPGPTIEANWGDTVVVHLTNNLTNNGTGLHFHGIRQNHTNQMDGVPSITQCPIAPGQTSTYTWRAVQYGSSWYHSHYSLQAWEGVLGGIVIHGPATSNYDVDLGVLFLNDWSHKTVDALYSVAETTGPPTLDNGLINGTNTYNGLGSRFNATFTSGTKYLIRLVNGAIDTHFKFSIDNHTLTVIGTDLVPIKPYNTQVLSIGIGQRYDIVVSANQSTANYWMRAIPQIACSSNSNAANIKGIVRYNSSNTADPTTTAYTYLDTCADETATNLVPYVSKTVGSYAVQDDLKVSVGLNTNNLFKWYINSTTMVVNWTNPTLLQVYNNVTTFTTSNAVIKLPVANQWVYFVIETTTAIPHPIHLHGHDFYILATGSGTYSNSTTLTLTNPPRRDTAMLPASGFLALAFQTDNPGAWLMHCHIGWHTSEGFALQLVERSSEINALIDYSSLNSTCKAWSTYQTSSSLVEYDSGV